jgi:hypothetical protein
MEVSVVYDRESTSEHPGRDMTACMNGASSEGRSPRASVAGGILVVLVGLFGVVLGLLAGRRSRR